VAPDVAQPGRSLERRVQTFRTTAFVVEADYVILRGLELKNAGIMAC